MSISMALCPVPNFPCFNREVVNYTIENEVNGTFAKAVAIWWVLVSIIQICGYIETMSLNQFFKYNTHFIILVDVFAP